MATIEERLADWQKQLFPSLPVTSLIERNPTAHKWKTTFRTFMLREVLFWRIQDLLTQSLVLYQQKHVLGARILLRSAVETLATLIYLNNMLDGVIGDTLDFHKFSETTTVLLMGARNNDDLPQSINVLTILKHADKLYPGVMTLYADLSESAHPSYEGLFRGFAEIDHDEYETTFSNRWMELYGDQHLRAMETCMDTFEHEYNDVWLGFFERLEKWIEANDEQLEATKNEPEAQA